MDWMKAANTGLLAIAVVMLGMISMKLTEIGENIGDYYGPDCSSSSPCHIDGSVHISGGKVGVDDTVDVNVSDTVNVNVSNNPFVYILPQ